MTDSTFIWVCPQCSTSYSDRAYQDYGGQCKLDHSARDLIRHHELPSSWRSESPAKSGPDAVETEEGEYDFGFGRSAPPAASVSPSPRGKLEWGPGSANADARELYGGRFRRDPADVMAEIGTMQRTIKVLVDRLGGKVHLEGMEAFYILMAEGQSPTPSISKDDFGRVVLTTEDD